MEFKEAMRIWKRMCKRAIDCNDCDAQNACETAASNINSAELEAILAKWAADHPERTIADDFFEKHPRAKRSDDGTPAPCAEDCGYVDKCLPGEMPCAECWRRPLEEVHHD